jgi:hypothetical protein
MAMAFALRDAQCRNKAALEAPFELSRYTIVSLHVVCKLSKTDSKSFTVGLPSSSTYSGHKVLSRSTILM